MTTKERAFVEYYLTHWNATEAARLAGYKNPNKLGPRKLVEVGIQQAIQARLSELKMSADEVLTRLSDQARGSMADFLRVDDETITLTWSLLSVPTDSDGQPDTTGVMFELAGQENVTPTDRVLHTAEIKRPVARLDLLEAGKRGKLSLVKKYSLDDKGKVSIELYDAQAALVQMGKAHGLFVERAELSGPGGSPIEVTAAQLAEARRRALEAEPDE